MNWLRASNVLYSSTVGLSWHTHNRHSVLQVIVYKRTSTIRKGHRLSYIVSTLDALSIYNAVLYSNERRASRASTKADCIAIFNVNINGIATPTVQ